MEDCHNKCRSGNEKKNGLKYFMSAAFVNMKLAQQAIGQVSKITNTLSNTRVKNYSLFTLKYHL